MMSVSNSGGKLYMCEIVQTDDQRCTEDRSPGCYNSASIEG